jgi:small subunit ribosomal protein S16
MLRIRLSRTGKKRQPSYRVVVAEREAKRDGRVVERIGFYNPRSEPAEFRIQEARALYWLSVGAQPSDAVRILLEKQGTFERLVRVHAGESIDHVVAEFQGVTTPNAKSADSPEAVEAAMAVAAVEAATLVIDEEE